MTEQERGRVNEAPEGAGDLLPAGDGALLQVSRPVLVEIVEAAVSRALGSRDRPPAVAGELVLGSMGRMPARLLGGG